MHPLRNEWSARKGKRNEERAVNAPLPDDATAEKKAEHEAKKAAF